MILITGLIGSSIIQYGMLESYEYKAVDVRTAEMQNQCTILGDQLNNMDLNHLDSEVIDAEISQLSNIYKGRVMVINQDYLIVKDSSHKAIGKTLLSEEWEEVTTCFQGEAFSHYDETKHYIEVGLPVFEENTDKVKGVVLGRRSTDDMVDIKRDMAMYSDVLQILLLIAVFIGSIVWTKNIIKPFRTMEQEVKKITAGHEKGFLSQGKYEESSQIADAVNAMLRRVRVLDESRDEFVANVSHELKTPITSIRVLADSLLEMEDAPPELYREFLSDIVQEIERENHIINDLLNLVKMDRTSSQVHIEQMNMNLLIEQILKRLRPIATHDDIEILMESFRPVTVEVDGRMIALAITNIVENAVKYNVPGGWVHVTLNSDHKYCYIKVEDSGIGIPKEDLEQIFGRFYRVDKSHSKEIGGTGLGLSIARNIVSIHKGEIKVYSKVGQGTTFTIRIPLTYVAGEKEYL